MRGHRGNLGDSSAHTCGRGCHRGHMGVYAWAGTRENRSMEAACSMTTATADVRLGCSSSEGSIDAAAQKLAQVTSHPSVSSSPFPVSLRMRVNGAAPEHMPHTSRCTWSTRLKQGMTWAPCRIHKPCPSTQAMHLPHKSIACCTNDVAHCSHNPCPTRCTQEISQHLAQASTDLLIGLPLHPPPTPSLVYQVEREEWMRVDTRGHTRKVRQTRRHELSLCPFSHEETQTLSLPFFLSRKGGHTRRVGENVRACAEAICARVRRGQRLLLPHKPCRSSLPGVGARRVLLHLAGKS